MPELSNPHDHFFKQVLSRPDAARDMVLNYLPAEVVAVLDPTSLALRKDSFVDGVLKEHFSDLLYQVALKDGQGAYVYVLLEHKSHAEPLAVCRRDPPRDWSRGFSRRKGGNFRPKPAEA